MAVEREDIELEDASDDISETKNSRGEISEEQQIENEGRREFFALRKE